MGAWKDRLRRVLGLGPAMEKPAQPPKPDQTGQEARSAMPTGSDDSDSSVRVDGPPDNKVIRDAEFRGFRFPAEWVKAGRHLQPPGSKPGRILSIRLGVDFGTAYTKAAVRIADSVYFVDFSGICQPSASACLLPGEISLGPSGAAWIGKHPGGRRILNELKLPFIVATDTSIESKAAATVFLSWVMCYLRAWVYKHHSKLLANRQLAWEVNLGMPSASWANEKLVSRYQKVACAAWAMSQEDALPTLSRAREMLLESSLSFDRIGLDDLQLIPEFVAQLAGYVMSPQRPEKGNELHLLVDVGAGTLDVACFGAYRPHGQDQYQFPTWASTVEALGTHFLMESRFQGIDIADDDWSDMSKVPDSDEFAAQFGVSSEVVRGLDADFSGSVSVSIGQVLTHTKLKRNPTAREWQSGIRVFMAGGGSSCPVYVSAVKHALRRVRSPMKEMSFLLHEVEDSQGIERELVHRLSVAYGLTFDAESIGEAVPPQDIKDFEPASESYSRPDRDELYPK